MLVYPLSHWDLPICQGSIREGSAVFIGDWRSQEGLAPSVIPYINARPYPYGILLTSHLPMAPTFITEQVYSSRDRAGVAVSPSSNIPTPC